MSSASDHQASTQQGAPARRKQGDMLRSSEERSRNLSRLCWQVRRMTSLVVAACASGHTAEDLLVRANDLTDETVKILGFDLLERQQIDAVRPMLLESVTQMLADAARAGEDPLSNRAAYVGSLRALAQDNKIARAAHKATPAGMRGAVSIQLAATHAMVPVLSEAMAFSFLQPAAPLMAEVGSALIKHVSRVAASVHGGEGNQALRDSVTESLLYSAGRVMAAVWSTQSDDFISQVNSLDPGDRELAVRGAKAKLPAEVSRWIMGKFDAEFSLLMSLSTQAVDELRPQPLGDQIIGGMSPKVPERSPDPKPRIKFGARRA